MGLLRRRDTGRSLVAERDSAVFDWSNVMRYEEAKKQWGVDGMPADKQRLAKAMYEAGQRDMREKCIASCEDVQLNASNEGFAAAFDIEKLIRAIELEG